MGQQYTKAELTKKSVAELKELAENLFDEDELEAIKTKSPLIDAIIESQSSDDEEDDEEDDDELDDSSPSEEDDEEDDELPEEDEVDDAPAEVKKTTKAKQTKYSEAEGTLGAKEVAAAVGTDAKTLRQFFRSPKSTIEPAGAGGRYEFTADQVEAIKTEFTAWKAGKPGRGRAAGEGGTATRRTRGAKQVAAADVLDEVEEIDDADFDELDDEDLELDD